MRQVQQTPPARDRWGRPVIDGVTYTRASSLAVDDKAGLIRWAAGMAAYGAATNPTIRNALAVLDPSDKDFKRDLYRLGDAAKDHAGASNAASDGTSIHKATEIADHGGDISALPAQLQAAVTAYQQLLAVHGLIPLAAEVFVACPALQVAGTLDRLVLCPDGTAAILDLKSSRSDAAKWSGLSWATQIAAYAHSDPWCADRGWLTWQQLGLIEPTSPIGLVAHVPQDGAPARLWRVDLDAGWEAARTAALVHAQRRATYLTDAGPGAGTQETNKKKNEKENAA